MNRLGRQNQLSIVIEAITALFVVFIFFGIIFPSLGKISTPFPGFSFILGLSFFVIIIAILAKVFGGNRR